MPPTSARERTPASWQEHDAAFSKPVCKWSKPGISCYNMSTNSQGDLAKQHSYYLPENLCRRRSRRNPSQLVEARRALSQNLSIDKSNRVYLVANQLRHLLISVSVWSRIDIIRHSLRLMLYDHILIQ